jgi:hypothetical protein
VSFIIAVLATWRLSSLIARERGPDGMFTHLRSLVGIVHGPEGTPAYDAEYGGVSLDPVSNNTDINTIAAEIAQAMLCVWCNSIWVAILLAKPRKLSNILAVSAGAILVDRLMETEAE